MRPASGLVSLSRPPSARRHLQPPPKGPHGFSPLLFPIFLIAHLAKGDAIFRVLVRPLWVCICKENLKIERRHRKMREQEVGSKKHPILTKDIRSYKMCVRGRCRAACRAVW